jgi:hypothetical protein
MKSKIGAILCAVFLLTWVGAAFAEEQVMFNYQGRVRVQGTAFNGTGYFKFAIVNNAGNVTLWSNDGTSVGGSEPVASIAVDVVEGIFNVMIGDPDIGMEPINRSIFNHPNQIKLRIWFSDGAHGFQQLLPDRRIVNPQLIGLVSGTEDFTIYVNGTTGNDENNGLTTDTAKQTIQAAVDVFADRLRCNVTIKIAPGIYREEVKIYDIAIDPGKVLTFLGDESWTPLLPGDPAVRITGCDSDATHEKVRRAAFQGINFHHIKVKGFLLDYASHSAIEFNQGHGWIENCKAAHNYAGFGVANNSRIVFSNCLAEHNDTYGFAISTFTWVTLENCAAKFNGSIGVMLNQLCAATFFTSGDYSNNTEDGIHVVNKALANFYDGYSGEIRNNGAYGLSVTYDACSANHTRNSFSGNAAGNVVTASGGHTY